MFNNEPLKSLVDCVGLEPQLRASVLIGTVEGVRTPCRCWRYTPKMAKSTNSQQSEKEKKKDGEEENEEDEDDARPYDRVHDFVLEVGMGDKTPELRALAESYIRRGTLCVMTVKVEHHGEFDIAWSYSLYCRGKARCSPGQVTTYGMVCSAQDVRVKTNENEVAEFPARLTLFDFVPSDVLKKKGATSKKDKKAVMNLSMGLEELGQTEARLGDFRERGRHRKSVDLATSPSGLRMYNLTIPALS
ncbi:hypothetical protein F5883DRAFT_654718 [Diaporthe sp. PMI_573]|nr:hypothetical protein F5883DRAFT_654718 [Diaporthaceae sp. PMI_573]